MQRLKAYNRTRWEGPHDYLTDTEVSYIVPEYRIGLFNHFSLPLGQVIYILTLLLVTGPFLNIPRF